MGLAGAWGLGLTYIHFSVVAHESALQLESTRPVARDHREDEGEEGRDGGLHLVLVVVELTVDCFQFNSLENESS